MKNISMKCIEKKTLSKNFHVAYTQSNAENHNFPFTLSHVTLKIYACAALDCFLSLELNHVIDPQITSPLAIIALIAFFGVWYKNFIAKIDAFIEQKSKIFRSMNLKALQLTCCSWAQLTKSCNLSWMSCHQPLFLIIWFFMNFTELRCIIDSYVHTFRSV